jgi:CTD kinase subunit alpha
MLELFTKKPVFQGNDEMHQLEVLYKVLGTPSPNDWPGLSEMPWFELVKPRHEVKSRFRDLFQK